MSHPSCQLKNPVKENFKVNQFVQWREFHISFFKSALYSQKLSRENAIGIGNSVFMEISWDLLRVDVINR